MGIRENLLSWHISCTELFRNLFRCAASSVTQLRRTDSSKLPRCKLEVAICLTHPEVALYHQCWSTNCYAIILHTDFAQWTDFDAIWSARRVGAVLPTPVTDRCAEAVHRSGNVELPLLNSRPKLGPAKPTASPERDSPDPIYAAKDQKTEYTANLQLKRPSRNLHTHTTSGHRSTARD